MTDFYTQLEHQLVAAGQRRAGQGRAARAVAGRGRALAAVTAAVAALVVAGAAAVPSVFDTAPSTRAPATPGGVRAPVPAAAGASLAGIHVAVYNTTTRAGLARSVARDLDRHGAVIVGISDGRGVANSAQTTVGYRNGAKPQARRVAAVLGSGVAVRPTGAAASNAVVPVVVFAGLDLTTSPPPAVAAPSAPSAPAAPPNLSGIAVTVLNGTSRASVARSVTRSLQGFGARRVVTRDGGPRGVRRTTVYYRPGARPNATRVADALGAARVRRYTPSLGAGSAVIVVAGLDRLRAPAAVPSAPVNPKTVSPTPTAPLPAPPIKRRPVPVATVPTPAPAAKPPPVVTVPITPPEPASP